MDPNDVSEIERALAEPFAPELLRFRAGRVAGGRAMALVYIDARVVQDRLDEVLGVMGWQDSIVLQPSGSAICTLKVRIGDQWISKMDIGSPSEQKDAGDREKAAFSDALKRAAIKFGVGRYLYKFGATWIDYDPQKKILDPRGIARLLQNLPDWARPSRLTAGTVPAATPPPSTPPTKPTKPTPRLEAPYVRDNDPAELIGADCQAYLEQLLADKGETVNHLCQHAGIAGIADLTYRRYETYVKTLFQRPDVVPAARAAS